MIKAFPVTKAVVAHALLRAVSRLFSTPCFRDWNRYFLTPANHRKRGAGGLAAGVSAWFAAPCLLLVWFLVSILLHPLPHGVSDRIRAPLLAGSDIAPAVVNVFERACINCHSEKTHWPWYSQVAPVSWVVENDVKQARNHLNLSRWD